MFFLLVRSDIAGCHSKAEKRPMQGIFEVEKGACG